MTSFRTKIRVYIEDTDAGGILYYVNYLKFMERSRTELLRYLGYNKGAMAYKNRLFVVSALDMKYQAPCRLDDLLEVETDIVQVGRASLVFSQRILHRGQLSCSATIKVANVNAQSLKPVALFKGLYTSLLNYQNRSDCHG